MMWTALACAFVGSLLAATGVARAFGPRGYSHRADRPYLLWPGSNADPSALVSPPAKVQTELDVRDLKPVAE
jgi:hypothetical protein